MISGKDVSFVSIFILRVGSGRRHGLFLLKLNSNSLVLHECSQYGMATHQIWGNETKQVFTNSHSFFTFITLILDQLGMSPFLCFPVNLSMRMFCT